MYLTFDFVCIILPKIQDIQAFVGTNKSMCHANFIYNWLIIDV